MYAIQIQSVCPGAGDFFPHSPLQETRGCVQSFSKRPSSQESLCIHCMPQCRSHLYRPSQWTIFFPNSPKYHQHAVMCKRTTINIWSHACGQIGSFVCITYIYRRVNIPPGEYIHIKTQAWAYTKIPTTMVSINDIQTKDPSTHCHLSTGQPQCGCL